jgi:hypothetical protein
MAHTLRHVATAVATTRVALSWCLWNAGLDGTLGWDYRGEMSLGHVGPLAGSGRLGDTNALFCVDPGFNSLGGWRCSRWGLDGCLPASMCLGS